MARRKETPKRRARWERMRPHVLARRAVYREVMAQEVGHSNARYAAVQAPPLPFCGDCGELHKRELLTRAALAAEAEAESEVL